MLCAFCDAVLSPKSHHCWSFSNVLVYVILRLPLGPKDSPVIFFTCNSCNMTTAMQHVFSCNSRNWNTYCSSLIFLSASLRVLWRHHISNYPVPFGSKTEIRWHHWHNALRMVDHAVPQHFMWSRNTNKVCFSTDYLGHTFHPCTQRQVSLICDFYGQCLCRWRTASKDLFMLCHIIRLQRNLSFYQNCNNIQASS